MPGHGHRVGVVFGDGVAEGFGANRGRELVGLEQCTARPLGEIDQQVVTQVAETVGVAVQSAVLARDILGRCEQGRLGFERRGLGVDRAKQRRRATDLWRSHRGPRTDVVAALVVTTRHVRRDAVGADVGIEPRRVAGEWAS